MIIMKKLIKVNGMSCDHCIRRINKAINEISGANCLSISLIDKTVEIEVIDYNVLNLVEQAIIDNGYEVLK